MSNLPTLLLCYDGSETSAEAIEQAAELFPKSSAVVLHTWRPIQLIGYGYMAWMGDVSKIDADMERESMNIAERGADLARKFGLIAKAESIQTLGSPGNLIVKRSNEGDIDMIVIGTVGHSTLGGALLGSVSNVVIHHATAPVLLVHPTKTELDEDGEAAEHEHSKTEQLATQSAN